MRKIKWILLIVLIALVFGFFHYTLPQKDIVRIVDVNVRRVDFGENSIFWASPDTGTANVTTRDVRFIETFYANGKPMIYRNEDTGWGWPPYFKLDSSNLNAEAADLVSTKENPTWVAVTHYGWRNEFFSIYPNAVGVKEVSGPDVKFIPWLNIFILTVIALCLLGLYRLLQRFKRRSIDPVLEDVSERWDQVEDSADDARNQAKGVWGRLLTWVKSWTS